MYLTYILNKQSLATEASNYIDDLFAGKTPDTSMLYTKYKPSTRLITRTIKITPTLQLTDGRPDTQNQILKYQKAIAGMRRIIELANKYSGTDMSTQYYSFKIPKKSGGLRQIDAPLDALKEDLDTVASILSNDLKLLPHNSAWAYVKHRDVVSAMKLHQNYNSRWFLKLDFKNFFGSCTIDFIKSSLRVLHPISEIAIIMPDLTESFLTSVANIATLNGVLPQGTPLSPSLTNYIMVWFDYELNKKLKDLATSETIIKQKYIYTRYADDIIISAFYKFDFAPIVMEVADLLKDTPLKLNANKTRFGSSSGRNWNLGIMLNKDNQLTVGYRKKQKLKATVHNFIVHRNEWTKSDCRWLLGTLNWLNSVQPDYFEGLSKYFKDKYNVDIIAELISDIKLT